MKVNYPNPSLNQQEHKVSKQKTHGMLFENALNLTNEFYRNRNMAIIYKKPTPIQVVRVDYPSRSRARIVEGYYKTASTTDYNGIYRGRYIDYEAKETNKLSFDFKHIYPHQLNHLNQIDEHGGIAFIIIYFKKVNEIYLIDIKTFYQLYQQGEKGGIKSISIEMMRKIGINVKIGYTPTIDYLQAVDQYYFKTPLS